MYFIKVVQYPSFTECGWNVDTWVIHVIGLDQHFDIHMY